MQVVIVSYEKIPTLNFEIAAEPFLTRGSHKKSVVMPWVRYVSKLLLASLFVSNFCGAPGLLKCNLLFPYYYLTGV